MPERAEVLLFCAGRCVGLALALCGHCDAKGSKNKGVRRSPEPHLGMTVDNDPAITALILAQGESDVFSFTGRRRLRRTGGTSQERAGERQEGEGAGEGEA